MSIAGLGIDYRDASLAIVYSDSISDPGPHVAYPTHLTGSAVQILGWVQRISDVPQCDLEGHEALAVPHTGRWRCGELHEQASGDWCTTATTSPLTGLHPKIIQFDGQRWDTTCGIPVSIAGLPGTCALTLTAIMRGRQVEPVSRRAALAHSDSRHNSIAAEITASVPDRQDFHGSRKPRLNERSERVFYRRVGHPYFFPRHMGKLGKAADLEVLVGRFLDDDPAAEEFLAGLRAPRGRRDEIVELANVRTLFWWTFTVVAGRLPGSINDFP